MKPASWLGGQRTDLDQCGSTNDEAARLARAGASHGAIVIAASQTSGRGRDGRVWASPPGAGLYLSIVLRPPLAPADVPPMTLAIGIAICDTARAHGVAAQLKWPNDVLAWERSDMRAEAAGAKRSRGPAGAKKLAGVLVEAQSQGGRLESVVVGIGVNLAGALPPELQAISIEAASHPVDRETFIAELLAQLELWIDRYVARGLPAIVDPWCERMAPGLAARAGALVGTCEGLDHDGALLLRDATGVHRVRSGDVEVIRSARMS